MMRQVLFHPAFVTGDDGWIELGGGTQPPNRGLPAAIFDDGVSYAPHNGNTGTWIIEKSFFVDSTAAGAGNLVIPPGTFPTGGGVYADDQVLSISLNGTAIPFTGIGGGVIPAQSQPVTFIPGFNTLRIVVNNTVAGGTSIAGQLAAEGVGAVPCDCCPTGPPQCALVGVQFEGANETTAQAGWAQQFLQVTTDGITATAAQSGYNSPAGVGPSTTLRVTYVHSVPQNRVRGLRIWGQGGGDLNDSDGPASYVAEFYSGVTLLTTLNCFGANGAAPVTSLLPAGQELNGVDRVVIRDILKLSASTVAPLWRELQLVEFRTVFPCRRSSGALQWYSADGVLVPSGDVVSCSDPVPLSVSNLTMTETALGDDPGLGERICSVVPPVTSSSGYTVLAGPCYDGSAANGDTLSWAGPLSSVSMSYESGGSASAGAALVAFSAPAIGTVTWPANGTKMLPNETRRSDNFPGGFATITYLPPAGTPANGAPSLDGGPNIRLGPAAVQAFTPYFFRIDFWGLQ